MKPGLSAGPLAESDYPQWNELVSRSEEGSVYSTPEYLRALCEASEGAFRILAVRRGDELLGGVALFERQARPGTYVAPRLLLYYNGIVLRPYETRYPFQRTVRRNEILETLGGALERMGYGRIELRCRSPLSDVRVLLARGWSARLHYTYVVPLTDIAALEARMEQNLRRLVHRCADQGIVVTDDDDFDSFYRMHSQVHERKGARLYLAKEPFRRFVATLRSAGLARLFHARLPDGRSISSQLVLLGSHPVSHTAAAGADPEHLRLGATAFLRWNVFVTLARMGIAANDLTDAALNPVTHFKGQLGGDLQVCLQLDAPESAAFRRERRYQDLRRTMRRKGGGVLRRLFRGGRPREEPAS